MDKDDLDKIICKLEGGTSGWIQLGGSGKPTSGGGSYVEGTSIPLGSVCTMAIFDKYGSNICFNDEGKADYSKGAVLHKEVSRGGESYDHSIFYVSHDCKVRELASFKDYYDSIIPVIGGPEGAMQVWYSFYGDSDIQRRHQEYRFIDGWVIAPFRKTHWGMNGAGFNPAMPMENGLIYYDTKTCSTLVIEKTPEIVLPHLLADRGQLNLKEDTLRIDGKEICSASGWIDIVRTEREKVYIDISDVIDMNNMNIGGSYLFEHAKPSDPADGLISREYRSGNFRKAGPQMRHTLKILDVKNGSVRDIALYTDTGSCGFEHYAMPAEKGVYVVSRKTGEKKLYMV